MCSVSTMLIRRRRRGEDEKTGMSNEKEKGEG
jgi:hypothetical protein